MKLFKINLILIYLILLLSSCTTTRYIEKTVGVDTIKVASPVIEDTLFPKLVTDTVVLTNKIIIKDTIKDTVIDIRYFPVEKKFYIKVKPDTITLIRIDTVTNTVIKEDKPFLLEIKNIIILSVVLFVIIFIIRIIKK